MDQSNPNRPSRLRFVWWLVAALALALVFMRVPAADALAAARQGRIELFLGVAVAFTILTYLLDSVVHFWLFRRFLPPIAAAQVFRARGETYLLLSLGAIYGQGGIAYVISRRADKPLAETAGALLFLMLNSLISVLIFPTLALILLAPGDTLTSAREWNQMPVWLGTSWLLCAAVVIFWAHDWKLPLRERLKRGLGSTLDRARPQDYAVAISLRSLQIVSWSFFSWLGLKTFGVEIPLSSLLVLTPVIGLAAVIPTPGRLGTSQGAWLLLFGAHYDPARILAFSLCWTVGVNLMRWTLGALFVAFRRKT